MTASYRRRYGIVTTLIFALAALVKPRLAGASGYAGPPSVSRIIVTVMGGLHVHSSLPSVLLWTALIGNAVFLMSTASDAPSPAYVTMVLTRMRRRTLWWGVRILTLTIISVLYTAWFLIITALVGLVTEHGMHAAPPDTRGTPWMVGVVLWAGLLLLGLVTTSLQEALGAPLAVFWGVLLASFVTAELYVNGSLGWMWTPLAYPSYESVSHGITWKGWPLLLDGAFVLMSGIVWLLIIVSRDII